MDCDDALLAIAARDTRALTRDERAGLASHLDACDACRTIAGPTASTGGLARDDARTVGSDPTVRALNLQAIARQRHTPLTRGEAIGRFLVLDILGRGGMGVVYSAYDPDLDRKVAIKLLLDANATEHDRARLLREAQAMARIKHANVIAVHEVGTFRDRVYVAMEYADDGTLQQWCAAARRSVRDTLAAFHQAGRGLAAAHAAGMVHRDFKPENVLRCRDGSVLVTDFGLVSAADEPPADGRSTPLSDELTRTGAVLGTPAYMAPEQFEGTATAQSDQFAFCVALYEALYGRRPFAGADPVERLANIAQRKLSDPGTHDVPGRVRRVLVRGLANDPAARFPSMEALLDALVRDPARRRRRAIAIAGGLATVAVVAAVRPGATPSCTGGADRVAAVWNPGRRAGMQAAFAASTRPHAAASFGRSAAILDDWFRGWEVAFTGACQDTERAEQSDVMLDRRMHCLTRRLDDARATIDALARGGDDAVDRAIETASMLPTLAPCADLAGLLAEVEPPDAAAAPQVAAIRARLQLAHSELQLGRHAKALALAKPAVGDARTVRYAPMIAEAQLLVGVIERGLGDFRASATTLEGALKVATEAGDPRLAVEAASWLVLVLSTELGGFEAAHMAGVVAEATAARARVPAEVEVHLEASLGTLFTRRHRPDEARAHLDRALARGERELGVEHPLVHATLQQLAELAKSRGRFAESRALLERVVESRRRLHGENHPSYANALARLGDLYRAEARLDDAQRVYDRALAIRLAAFGPEHPEVGTSYNSIGSLHVDRDDNATALVHYRKALAIHEKAHGADNVELAPAVLNIGLALSNQGDNAGARRFYERGAALLERAHGPEHAALVNALTNLGVLAHDEGRFADAIAIQQRVVRIVERVYGADHPDAADAMTNIGISLKKLNRLDEAEDATVRALRATEKAFGADHTRTAMGLTNLGDVLTVRGRHAETLEVYRKSAAIFERRMGSDHAHVSFPLLGEGQALIALGRGVEAIPILERALAIRSAAKMPLPAVAEVRFALARALATDPTRRARARAEAAAAASDYETAGGAGDAATIRAWLRRP